MEGRCGFSKENPQLPKLANKNNILIKIGVRKLHLSH